MDPKVTFSRAQESEAGDLGSRMRREDRLEVYASGRFGAEEAVCRSLQASESAWSVRYDGTLAFMFGIAAFKKSLTGNSIGIPWVLTTDLVAEHPKLYLKITRRLLPIAYKDYDLLVNFVDHRYNAAKKWLKLLGFTVGDPVKYGPDGELFCPFMLRKDRYV